MPAGEVAGGHLLKVKGASVFIAVFIQWFVYF